MYYRILMFVAIGNAVVTLAGCSTIENLFERESKIPLEQLPANVRAGAELAVPGLVLESAEVEKTKRAVAYELEGRANGREYELHVDENGNVTAMKYEVETEGEDQDREN
ncbi:MAG TPA: PepSY domain-containing protein [Opitutaceae bacterium]